jgi:rhodanese-related sulfurtransferase
MKEVNAKEAHELMNKDPMIIYLDVRSVPEFEQGHPVNAINIPLMHFTPGLGMVANEEFERVVAGNLPKTAQILVGCKTGGRSSKACELMSQMGYSNVTNVRGGFVGVMDQFGQLTEPGWSLLQLPTCASCGAEAHYDALLKRSKP